MIRSNLKTVALIVIAGCHGGKDGTPPENTDEAVDTDVSADTDAACVDDDQDLVCADLDDCPETYNPDQADVDGDGAGDVCDAAPGTPGATPVDGAAVVTLPENASTHLTALGGRLAWTIGQTPTPDTHTAVLLADAGDAWERWVLYRSGSDDVALAPGAVVSFEIPHTAADILGAIRAGTLTTRTQRTVMGAPTPIVDEACTQGGPTPCASLTATDNDEDLVPESWTVSVPVERAGEVALVGEAPTMPSAVPMVMDDAVLWGGSPKDPGLTTATWDEQLGLPVSWLVSAGGTPITLIADGFTAHSELPTGARGVIRLGRDTVDGDDDPTLASGVAYGTKVAGLIAAEPDSDGIAGAAHRSAVTIVRGIGGTLTQLTDAINWSVADGAKIIVISGGTDTNNQAMHDAVDAAWAAGAIVINAAGGIASVADQPRYPAAFDHVVAVTAVGTNGSLLPTARHGAWVDLAAPGEALYTTFADGQYGTESGTSAAVAFVAAAAADVWSQHPGWSNQQIVDHLVATGAPLPNAGVSDTFPVLDLAEATFGGAMRSQGPWFTSGESSIGTSDWMSEAALMALGSDDGRVATCRTGGADYERGGCSIPLDIPANTGVKVSVRYAVCSEEAPAWTAVGYDDRVQIAATPSRGIGVSIVNTSLSQLTGWIDMATLGGTIACTPFTDVAPVTVQGEVVALHMTAVDTLDPLGETFLLVDQVTLTP